MNAIDSEKYQGISDGENIDIGNISVNVKGKKPDEGTITITKGKVITARLCINGYWVNYENNKSQVDTKCTPGVKLIKEVNPAETNSTLDSITIPINAVEGTTITATAVDSEGNEITGTIVNGVVTFSGLKAGKNYTYTITAQDSSGNETVRRGTITTTGFNNINISEDDSDWTQKKTITITTEENLNGTGTKLQYKVGNGSWSEYTEAFEVNSNTSVYARLVNGENTSDEETLTITTIDKTKPNLVLGSINVTENSIVIPIDKNEDNESEIASTTCEYGPNENYGSNGSVNLNKTECTISLEGNDYNKYYYKITTTNNAGLSETAKGNIKVGNDSGDLLYFDPVSESTCNSSTFNLNNIKNGTSTCYKWRTISEDKTNNTLTVQLDHNLINFSNWCSTSKSGPDIALSSLANETSSWARVPGLNYSYDTTSGTFSYGILTCTSGVCKISQNGTETIIAGPTSDNDTTKPIVRARLITGEEIAKLTKDAGAANNSIAGTWSLSNNSDYYFSHTNYILGTKTSGSGNTILSWLIENTMSNSSSGATANNYMANVYGYLTLSQKNTDYINLVSKDGTLATGDRILVNEYYGLRPVITLSKSNFTS